MTSSSARLDRCADSVSYRDEDTPGVDLEVLITGR
jgi:hypothetical protein